MAGELPLMVAAAESINRINPLLLTPVPRGNNEIASSRHNQVVLNDSDEPPLASARGRSGRLRHTNALSEDSLAGWA